MKNALNLIKYVPYAYIRTLCVELYGKDYQMLTDAEMYELEHTLNQQLLNDY